MRRLQLCVSDMRAQDTREVGDTSIQLADLRRVSNLWRVNLRQSLMSTASAVYSKHVTKLLTDVYFTYGRYAPS